MVTPPPKGWGRGTRAGGRDGWRGLSEREGGREGAAEGEGRGPRTRGAGRARTRRAGAGPGRAAPTSTAEQVPEARVLRLPLTGALTPCAGQACAQCKSWAHRPPLAAENGLPGWVPGDPAAASPAPGPESSPSPDWTPWPVTRRFSDLLIHQVTEPRSHGTAESRNRGVTEPRRHEVQFFRVPCVVCSSGPCRSASCTLVRACPKRADAGLRGPLEARRRLGHSSVGIRFNPAGPPPGPASRRRPSASPLAQPRLNHAAAPRQGREARWSSLAVRRGRLDGSFVVYQYKRYTTFCCRSSDKPPRRAARGCGDPGPWGVTPPPARQACHGRGRHG
jgi:hypothetical protein